MPQTTKDLTPVEVADEMYADLAVLEEKLNVRYEYLNFGPDLDSEGLRILNALNMIRRLTETSLFLLENAASD